MRKSQLIIWFISFVVFVDTIDAMFVEAPSSTGYHVDSSRDVRREDEKLENSSSSGGVSVKGPSLAVKKTLGSSGGMQVSVDMSESSLMPDYRSVVPLASDGVQFMPEGKVETQRPSYKMVDPIKLADSHPVQGVIDPSKLLSPTYANTVVHYDKTRMSAPMQSYITVLHDARDSKGALKFQYIPDSILATYAAEFIKQTSGLLGWKYTPEQFVAYSRYKNWENMNDASYSLNNLYKGLATLHEVLNPTYQQRKLQLVQRYMNGNVHQYVTALRVTNRYRHVPDELLIAYTLEFLNDSVTRTLAGYTNGKISPANLARVIIGKFDEVTKEDPSDRDKTITYNNPTLVQQLYGTMQALESIHTSYAPEVKSPGGSVLATSFQDKMKQAIEAVGNVDRLLVKCGVDITNVANPTAEQSVVQTVNNQLKLHNPIYTKFQIESHNGTSRLLTKAQQDLFKQFRIDFVLFNQDIAALQAKIAATGDRDLKVKYNTFLTTSQTLRDQMNELIIRQKTTDMIPVYGPLKGVSIDDAIAHLPKKEGADIIVNEATPIRDRLQAQDDMALYNVTVALRAVQKSSEAWTTGEPISAHDMRDAASESIRIFYQDVNGQLAATRRRLGRAPTLTEILESIKLIQGVLWDQMRAQLTMNLGVEQRTAQRIQTQVDQKGPVLWTAYLGAQQDPILRIFDQLKAEIPNVPSNSNVNRQIVDLEVQYKEQAHPNAADTQRIETALIELYDRNNKLESLKVYADVITALRPKILRKNAIEAQIKGWAAIDHTSIDDVLAKANTERDRSVGYEKDIWAEEIKQLGTKKVDETKAQENKQKIDDKIYADTERFWALDQTPSAIDRALEELQANLQDIQGSDKDKSDAAAAIRLIQEYNRSTKDQTAVGAFVRALHALKSKLEAVDVSAGIIPKLEAKIIAKHTLDEAIAHKIAMLKRGNATIQEAIDAAQEELKAGVEANIPKLTGAIKILQQELIVEGAIAKKNKEIKDAALKLIPPLLDPLVQNPVDVALKQLQAALTEGDQPELAVINKLIMQYDDGNINLAEFLQDVNILEIRPDRTLEKQVLDILNKLSLKKDGSEILKTYAQVVIELDRLEGLKAKRSNTIAGIVEQLAPVTTPQETYRLVVENIAWIENKLNEVLRPNGKVAQLTQQELKVQIDEFKKKLQDKNIGNINDIKVLIKLYEEVLQQLKIAKDIADENGRFNQGRMKLGQALQRLDASKAASGVADIGAGVAEAVWAGLDAMGLKKENFSKEALSSIAVIITGISTMLITIQNNQHMTAEEKKKAQNAAFKAGFMDIANVAIADQTGASAHVIATGNAEAIAMDAGFNRIINMLVPNDPNSYSYNSAAITSGDYMGNLNKFKTNYEELEQKQAEKQSDLATPVKKTSSYGSSYSNPDSSISSYSPSSYPSIDDLMSMTV